MNKSKLLTRYFGYCLCVTMLLAAMFPVCISMSDASERGVSGGGIPFAEICSVSLRSLTSVDSATKLGPDQDSKHSHSHNHCPWCAYSHHFATLPAQVNLGLNKFQTQDLIPLLFLEVAKTPFIWSSSQPRAPPSI